MGKHNASKEFCPQGHPYSGDNLRLVTVDGKSRRHCKACERLNSQNFRAKQVKLLGPCEICGEYQEKALAYDHIHGHCDKPTGCGECRRGRLCHRCNLGLGYFRDSEEFLGEAIKYLRKSTNHLDS